MFGFNLNSGLHGIKKRRVTDNRKNQGEGITSPDMSDIIEYSYNSVFNEAKATKDGKKNVESNEFSLRSLCIDKITLQDSQV